MSRNKNNRLLLIIFLVLLVAVVANQLIKSSKGERSFRGDFIEYTADEISKISILTKNNSGGVIDLFREDTAWKVTQNGKKYPADRDMAAGIVEELAAMKPDRLVANKKDLWKDYDVTDTSGVLLTVFGPKKSKTELIIGRFSYNQATRKPSTFIRLKKENEVYAVEGYLSMTFNRDVNGLRDKSIFRGNKNDFTRLSLAYPGDSSLTFTKEESKWLCNGQAVDSTRMAQYLSGLGYLYGTDFRDDFTPSGFSGTTFTLTIEGINMRSLEIKAFKDASGIAVNSSENRETYFAGDKGGLADKIFRGRSFFYPAPAK